VRLRAPSAECTATADRLRSLEGPEGGKNDFVAVRSNPWSESPGDLVTGSNAVSVVVPARRYTDVVRLVVAGFVSRMLGFEAVDDIQLALEAIVRSVAPDGTHVRVSLASDGEWLTLAVGSFQLDELERRLRAVVSDDIALVTLLERLVDTVEVVDGAAASIVMRKRCAGSVA
jgi:hypothetical protein